MVLLDSPIHVDAVTDESKLPWHKYLKGKSSHLYNHTASLSPALDNMKVVTELMAGLCTCSVCVFVALGVYAILSYVAFQTL